jgi:tetratricopeptide (TPR) repeat protein
MAFFKKTCNPNDLLKEATYYKREGNINKAILLLRKAYKILETTPIQYSINIYLRLPLYLQQARRTDEAWVEFNNLITKGYPNQPRDIAGVLLDNSVIYDKMRLFLEREGKPLKAIDLGIQSFMSKVKGLRLLKRKEKHIWEEDYNQYISEDNIEYTFKKLLKIKDEDTIKKVISTVQKYIKIIQKYDFSDLKKDFDSIGIYKK